MKQKGELERKLKQYTDCESELEEIELMCEMADEGEDEELADEAAQRFDALRASMEELRLKTLMTDEYDGNNAILSIHPGAGGIESQDWAAMLLRMYTRYSEAHGYKVKFIDYQPDPEAGIKSVTLLVEGELAYGHLKCERGVHRLVRISPYNAAGKRQTSFASVDVIPALPEDIKVEIDPNDLRIDTYRSSGAGGQHVNKTDSAVRITHLPTGIVVTCQNERSQIQNREYAMRMLYSKLQAIAKQEHKDKISDISGDHNQIAWGSQIISYVFQPYTMVKDHRTEAETSNVGAVMDGALDTFINASLNASKKS
jgi:peptide chain release factor 2